MARSDAFVHGYVVGIAVSSRGDGDDTNALPDVAPAPVQITFTRLRGQYTHPLPTPDAGAHGMFVLHDRVVCGVIPSGEHVGHLTSDLTNGKATATSTPGVWLITGQYRVSAAGHFPEFEIDVTADHTPEAPLDLYSAVPYVPPPGADVRLVPLPPGGSPGQYLTPLAGGGHGWADAPSGDGGAAQTWDTLPGKPPVIAAGTSATAARNAIGAGTSNLQLGTGPTTAAAGNHTHTPASIGAAPASHAHDDRYYTESEVDTALAGKAGTSHQHPVTDLTATGTPSETTYLRGDGTWATPEGQGPSHESILASGSVTLPTEHPVLTIRADDPATLSLPEAPDGTVVTIHVAHGWENLTWSPGITVTGDSATTETWVVLVRAEGAWKALVSGESGGGSGILTGNGNPNTLGIKAATVGVLYADEAMTDGAVLWSADFVHAGGATDWVAVKGYVDKWVTTGGGTLDIVRWGSRLEVRVLVELTGGGNGEEVTLPASTIDFGEVDEGLRGSPFAGTLVLVPDGRYGPPPVELPPIMCVFTQNGRYVLHMPEVVIPAYTSPDPVILMGSLELVTMAPWPEGSGGGVGM